jgi:hypothetical protein
MKLRPDNPALSEHRTVFPYRVKTVTEVKRVLQSVAHNSKLGNGVPVVAKGKWRGMAAFTLTLEERATCPSTCTMWADCYGNNLRFATRISSVDMASLQERLETEVKALLRTYGRILVRLHVLGDFATKGYAEFWARMMREHKCLHIFGFTQWPRDSEIGRAVQTINDADPERVWIRFSNAGGPMSANVEGEGIPCPEQIGKTASCMTCGLCWSTTHPISFKRH